MSIKIGPITSKREHTSALATIERLWDARAGSREADARDVLVILVEDYESRTFPIDPPDPVDAIKFRLEQLGLEPAELGRILGSRSRASEVLRRKRTLSLDMIRKLHEKLGVPYESLIPRSAGAAA